MKRKLLFLERLMLGDGTAPFNGVFVVSINGTLVPENLYHALSKVQAKHPLLRAGIVHDKAGVPHFSVSEKYTSIPVTIQERVTDDDWIQASRDAWAAVFDLQNGPLIKLVWIKGAQQSELLLAFHHCMCDGGGGLMLVQEILTLLDNPDKDIGAHPAFTTVADIVPAAILTSTGRVMKARFQGTLIKMGLAVIAAFTSSRNKKNIPRESDYLLHWKLDKKTSSALFHYCTINKVTVNTALCVAFLSAFRQVKGDKALNKITCPVDIRKFIPEIKKDSIFSFGLSLSLSISTADVPFWEKVKLLQAVAAQKLKGMNPYDFLLPFEYAHSAINHMRKFLTYGKVNYDLMFSNMGKLDVPDKFNSFEIETIFSPTVIGPFANPNTIITSTYKGQIDFSFVSNEAFLDYTEALAIKEQSMTLLFQELHVPSADPVLS
jgi:NRPS condensation-like uncharacterized protein